jgi:hypothetical protein
MVYDSKVGNHVKQKILVKDLTSAQKENYAAAKAKLKKEAAEEKKKAKKK